MTAAERDAFDLRVLEAAGCDSNHRIRQHLDLLAFLAHFGGRVVR